MNNFCAPIKKFSAMRDHIHFTDFVIARPLS